VRLEDNTVYEGDCRELFPLVPDRSVQLVLADPPFGIDFEGKPLNYNRTASRVMEGYQEYGESYLDFTRQWIAHLPRVLADTGCAFVFSGWNRLKEVLLALDETGLTTINHLVWKYQFGVYTRRRFVTSHYHILFAVKNPRKYRFNKQERYPEDVINIKREYWHGRPKTPTKLPLALVEKLISFTTDQGDLVLDPFLGSGTTGVAALKLGRRFLGFEIVPEYAEFARERIKEESKGVKPPRD